MQRGFLEEDEGTETEETGRLSGPQRGFVQVPGKAVGLQSGGLSPRRWLVVPGGLMGARRTKFGGRELKAKSHWDTGEVSLGRRIQAGHSVPSRSGSPGLPWPVSPTHTVPGTVCDTLSRPCLRSKLLCQEGLPKGKVPGHPVSKHVWGWRAWAVTCRGALCRPQVLAPPGSLC